MNNRTHTTVKLLGNLTKTSDGRSLKTASFKAPVKLSHILRELSEKYHLDLRRDSLLILVDGVEANALDDVETLVQPDQEVVFVPMFHGGSQ